MFSLLSGLWQYIWQKVEFNCILLGLDNAGKTVYFTTSTKHTKTIKAFLEQLKFKYSGLEPLPPHKLTPTVGLNSTLYILNEY